MLEYFIDKLLTIVFSIMELLAIIIPEIFKVVMFCIMLLAIWIPLSLFQGCVLMTLWGWFVVPTGIHALTIQSAMGISLILSLLTAHFGNITSKKDLTDYCSYWLISQLLILITGYFIKTVLAFIKI